MAKLDWVRWGRSMGVTAMGGPWVSSLAMEILFGDVDAKKIFWEKDQHEIDRRQFDNVCFWCVTSCGFAVPFRIIGYTYIHKIYINIHLEVYGI